MPMSSLRELFRLGAGPSSSHTMGPQLAAQRFLIMVPEAHRYSVTLYGSLAATGRGHMTDRVLDQVFQGRQWELIWEPEQFLDFHPNAMRFEAYRRAVDDSEQCISSWEVFSVGGGALREAGQPEPEGLYELTRMGAILDWCQREGKSLWQYVEHEESKSEEIEAWLRTCWKAMRESLERGLSAGGILPGGLHLPRKAKQYYQRALELPGSRQQTGLLSSYALAVMEENASARAVVTAPTCGACGVVPAILRYGQEVLACDELTVIRALATAGLIGNLVKHNASISGAEVGCQGEVGTACAMAAGALCQMMGGSPQQVEYAAEMGMEHHLGLTCDPILGLVQIPCIERNAFAAHRAWACAEYAMLSEGQHEVSFDTVIQTMYQTGLDLDGAYRETSVGGLALEYLKAQHPM